MRLPHLHLHQCNIFICNDLQWMLMLRWHNIAMQLKSLATTEWTFKNVHLIVFRAVTAKKYLLLLMLLRWLETACSLLTHLLMSINLGQHMLIFAERSLLQFAKGFLVIVTHTWHSCSDLNLRRWPLLSRGCYAWGVFIVVMVLDSCLTLSVAGDLMKQRVWVVEHCRWYLQADVLLARVSLLAIL